MIREETYIILIDYIEKEILDHSITDNTSQKDTDESIEELITRSMIDQDKSARAKGIILTEKYLLILFKDKIIWKTILNFLRIY